MFTKLINDKKVTKITSCPIVLPQSKELEKLRKRRVALRTDSFAKYLEFFIAKDLRAAIKEAPLVKSGQITKFRKIKLGAVVEDIFSTFKTLFDYALKKESRTFEAEFNKYFNIDDTGDFDNCLQVANCWISAMESCLKRLIALCELSSQTIFLHQRTELVPFQDVSIFLPKQIASKETSPASRFEDLETKHMAHLLRKSLFTMTKKKEIKLMLNNVEHRSRTLLW